MTTERDCTLIDGRTGVGRRRRPLRSVRARLSLSAGIVALVGLMAACSGGESATGPSVTSPSATAPSASVPSTTTSSGSTPVSGAVRPPATTATTETTQPEVPTTAAPTTTEPPTTTSTTEPATVPSTEPVAPTTVVVGHKSTTITAQSTTSTTPVGWIIAGVVVALLLILAVVLLIRSRSRRRALDAWSTEVGPVLAQAAVVRDRLVDAHQQDPAARAATAEQLQSVTASLSRIADSAPSDEAAAAANVVGENLRGLSFAQEAAGLLRSGPSAPSGEQLAQADQTSRTQLTQLDAAITGLTRYLEPKDEATHTPG